MSLFTINLDVNWPEGIAVLKSIERQLRRLNGPPSLLSGFSLTFTEEITVAKVKYNRYTLTIPQIALNDDGTTIDPNLQDVLNGGKARVKATQGGLDVANQDFDPNTVEVFEEYDLKQDGQQAEVSFVWVDDAGNESEVPLVIPAFEVSDKVKPSNPAGGFGLVLTAEVEKDE